MAIISAVLGIGVLTIIIYCFRRKLWFHILNGSWKGKSKAHQDFEAFLRNHGPLPIKRYNYLEIKKMTNSLSEKLGQGGCGGVFKGKIHDEKLVAVKMLDRSKHNGDEFMNEVASISRTSHVNIVTLLGFCFEGSKRALVYEYMANGSLEKFIHGTNPMAVGNQLNCETLYQIALGVALGLEYLHRDCNTRIFHFDIKPHNILLDENFCPKISDFGLAKICPQDESMVSMLDARGTPGYIAPEVFSRSIGVVSHKSDVYGFGMMVLEMVGGRKNINVEVDCTSEIYFPYWIYKRLELNEELDLKNITNESDRERMKRMVIVSLWCIQIDPQSRPTMRRVRQTPSSTPHSSEPPPPSTTVNGIIPTHAAMPICSHQQTRHTPNNDPNPAAMTPAAATNNDPNPTTATNDITLSSTSPFVALLFFSVSHSSSPYSVSLKLVY
ncbi:hypothetical protein RIF29_16386 [Crotalaria pallida]|uniref:Protein kinase domain-containing protein n=1 Tax=Crotalaria pallida TaxID=3830 RepID=A0AAN9IFI1_CROPI